jgi:hypothetical protein
MNSNAPLKRLEVLALMFLPSALSTLEILLVNVYQGITLSRLLSFVDMKIYFFWLTKSTKLMHMKETLSLSKKF